MGNGAVQKFMMLVLTIAVGVLFIVRVPRPQDAEIARLEQQLHGYETALAQLQAGPTATLNLLATPQATATLSEAILDVPPGTTPDLALPPVTGGDTDFGGTQGDIPPGVVPTLTPALPTPAPGMPAVIDAAVSLSVDFDGCANNPRTVFTNFETMYVVGRFTNMRAGDRITFRIFYNENSSIVDETIFTVEEPGDFCRYWDMVPDEFGWDVGSYSFAVQVNQDVPRVVNYTIGILSSTAEGTTE